MAARYIAFDCETTGFSDACNLLTVTFLALDNHLNVLNTLNLSLKQQNGYVVFPEALAVNKISLEKHHSESLSLEDARAALFAFLERHKTKYVLIPVGHNIAFDIRFIQNSGLLAPQEYSKYFSHNPLDTLTIAQYMKASGHLPLYQSVSLENLCTFYNIATSSTLQHTSHYDTVMTVNVLKEFIKNTRKDTIEHPRKKRKIDA